MRARRGHDRMVIVFTLQLSMQSVSITSKIESLHPAHGFPACKFCNTDAHVLCSIN